MELEVVEEESEEEEEEEDKLDGEKGGQEPINIALWTICSMCS